jgi:hypothetical protein
MCATDARGPLPAEIRKAPQDSGYREERPRLVGAIHLASLLIQKVVPLALAVWLVLLVRDTALSLSGEDTLLAAWISLTSNIRVSRGFALVFGGAGIYYGISQRNLRRAELARATARIAELERRLLAK